jgi:hypothetical protein
LEKIPGVAGIPIQNLKKATSGIPSQFDHRQAMKLDIRYELLISINNN